MTAHLDLGDVNARRAIDAPADAPLLAIVGAAASGKTETLARRYIALLARDATLGIGASIVTAASADGAARLAARIDELLPPERAGERNRDGRYLGTDIAALAFDVLAEHATLTGLAYDLETIDAADAQEIFERAIAPLFSAEWSEFLGPDVDPEIPGLRAPERFAVAVLRLIRKLRAAHISPEAFLKTALSGATAFYANPPNLSAPALLMGTKDEHRGALAVEPAERERQRRREIDLAKIITKLYRSYLSELVGHGCLTAADAIAEATRLLEEHPAIARTCRRRFRIAVVDDVHDLPTGEFRLLGAIFGAQLAGVTVAGDPEAATRTFAGARPERIFAAAATTLRLQAGYRVPAQIAAVVRALLAAPPAPAALAGDAVTLHRAATPLDEAAFVAASVAAKLHAGTPAGRIAVLHRSLRALAVYEDALVDRGIPIALVGDGALFTRHETLDALALLWTTVDPFAHAWLLRVLQMPLLDVSDATLAILCGEPASPQALLFDVPPEAGDGSRRWDHRRDVRLGTNVVRGDRDTDLEPQARARLGAFRLRRARWQTWVGSAPVVDAARAILSDAALYEQRPGETPARTRRRGALVDALLALIARYAARHPGRELADVLLYCRRIARSEIGPDLADMRTDAVTVAAIDRVKGRRFDHVFVVDVRAGSFPPYYVPDAFLFSPTYGMVPKDSVGEAVTARTAKFTWYAHHAKLRETYGREDRRALTVALARADVSATVSAAGRPTRGIAAPEFLVELQALRPALPFASIPPAGPPEPRSADAGPAQPPPQPEPTLAGPALIAIERLAEMLRCVQCAGRGGIGRGLDATFTFLSGRLPQPDRQIEARDVQFAFALDATVVFGAVPALIRHAGQTYAVVARHDEGVAALVITGLRGRVADTAFFTETADGVFHGPHALDVDRLIAAARSVLAGSTRPACPEHRLT